MKHVVRTRGPARPWGMIVAMLTGSLVTLVGVACGLDPDVILLRAAGAAAALGAVTGVGSLVTQVLMEKRR